MTVQTYFMSKVIFNRALKGNEKNLGMWLLRFRLQYPESRFIWSNLCIHHLCKEELAQRTEWAPVSSCTGLAWAMVPQRRGHLCVQLGGRLMMRWQPSCLVSGGAGRKEGGYLNRQYFHSSLVGHRWSRLGLLQCWRCLCLNKQLWTVFCMCPLNFPGAVDILVCGNNFSAMCGLAWVMFHASSRPFPWGREMIFCYSLWNASRVLVGL